MLLSVSTVKDTLPNLERFVAGNLAGGVDHLVIFLDAEAPDVRAFLEAHPLVTCVSADERWWADDRPAELNVRQRINANAVKAVLSTLGWARSGDTWLFHIDADEIIQVDREVLASVPPEARVVALRPLEAVAQPRWDSPPTLFKRLLGKEDLTLLTTLGVIDRAHNGAYFHGHVDGKSGIRPDLEVSLTLHQGVDAAGTELDRFADDRLSLLHYESYSGDDFVRKWTSILSAGPVPNFRPAREPTAVALAALIGKGLSAERAAPYLMRIFERTTCDDLDTLRDLELLVEVDPALGAHRPAALPDHGARQLAAGLAALEGVGKRPFHPGTPAEAVRAILRDAGLSPEPDRHSPPPPHPGQESEPPGEASPEGLRARVRAGRSLRRRS